MGRNYMMDFAQGYGFVDNIHRQRRQEAEQAKDSALRREMYGLKMDNTRDIMSQRDAEREVGRARTEAFRLGLQPEENPVHQGYAEGLREMGLSSPEAQQATGKMKPLLDNPDRAGKALALAENIKLYLDQGEMPPGGTVAEYANLVGESELQARSQDGLVRKVKRFLPNQRGDGLFVEFDVTRPDGSHYAAPATTGKSADPSDNTVQNYSMQEVLDWFGGSYAALMMVLDAEAKAGVSTTATAFQQHRQARQAEQQKRAQTLEDEKRGDQRTLDRYRGQKEIDQEFAEPERPDTQIVPLPDGRVKLIDKQSGGVIATYGSAAEVPGGAGSGAGTGSPEVRHAYAEVRKIINDAKNASKLTPREVSQIQAVLRNVGHWAKTEDVTKGYLWFKKAVNEITGFGPIGEEEVGGQPGTNPVIDQYLSSLTNAPQPDAPQPDAPQPDAPQPDAPQPYKQGTGELLMRDTPANTPAAGPSGGLGGAVTGGPLKGVSTVTGQAGQRDNREQHAKIAQALASASEQTLLPVAQLVEERYKGTPEAIEISKARTIRDFERLGAAVASAAAKFGDVYEALTGVGSAGVYSPPKPDLVSRSY